MGDISVARMISLGNSFNIDILLIKSEGMREVVKSRISCSTILHKVWIEGFDV